MKVGDDSGEKAVISEIDFQDALCDEEGKLIRVTGSEPAFRYRGPCPLPAEGEPMGDTRPEPAFWYMGGSRSAPRRTRAPMRRRARASGQGHDEAPDVEHDSANVAGRSLCDDPTVARLPGAGPHLLSRFPRLFTHS